MVRDAVLCTAPHHEAEYDPRNTGGDSMATTSTPVTNPNVTRSRLVLEIASEMAGGAAADAVPDYILSEVAFRHSRTGKRVRFSASSSRCSSARACGSTSRPCRS